MELSGERLSVSLSGRKVLEDVSISLSQPGITALLGLNGAGKTTLLRTLAGLLKPEGGAVYLDGTPIEKLSPRQRARQVGYLPQSLAHGTMTVEEYVLLGAAPWLNWGAVPGAKWEARAQRAMERLGIDGLAHRSMAAISGGESRRAALAQALVAGPAVLLLDEPAAGLDLPRQHEFFDLLAHLLAREGHSALVSVHDPNLALSYGDRAVVLAEGELTILERGADFGPKLAGLLNPIYGPELRLSPQGHFYWNTKRSEDTDVYRT